MLLQNIHHVAYRCRDAQETVAWYQDKLGMPYVLGISEDRVPSTKEPDPYMHVFLDAGGGNVLAFFELPNSPPQGRDPNTPGWVQHIAFRLADMAALRAAQADLEAKGVDVVGPIDHGIFTSIYCFDPNGHRLELAVDTGSAEQMAALRAVAPRMLEEWGRSKATQPHAAWLHAKEFRGG